MTILEELYNGNLEVTDMEGLPSKEINSLLSLVDKNKQRLEDSIGKEQHIALERFFDSANELSVLTECDAFVKGFSIAVKMMMQALK